MKNGKFVGRNWKAMSNEECYAAQEVINRALPNIRIESIEFNGEFNDTTAFTCTIKFDNKTLLRNRDKDYISHFTKIIIRLTKQDGFSTYETMQQCNDDPAKQDMFNQYQLWISTNGSQKDYYKHSWYPYEPSPHFMYDDDLYGFIPELREALQNAATNIAQSK